MKWLVYLSVLWAGAATANALVPIDYNNPPPADWPQLTEYVTYVEPRYIHGQCNGPVYFRGQTIRGCSVVSFEQKICIIYISDQDPALLEHERAHCRGYGHVGSRNAMAEAWEKHKASKQ